MTKERAVNKGEGGYSVQIGFVGRNRLVRGWAFGFVLKHKSLPTPQSGELSSSNNTKNPTLNLGNLPFLVL